MIFNKQKLITIEKSFAEILFIISFIFPILEHFVDNQENPLAFRLIIESKACYHLSYL